MSRSESYSLITAPSGSVVTLAEVKRQCRIDVDDWDLEIQDLADMATDWASDYTRRALLTQTWEFYFPCFSSAGMDIPKPPLVDVVEIRYLDTDGDEQPLDSSVYDVISDQDLPSKIVLAKDEEWPDTQNHEQAVTIKATVGYGSSDDVPNRIKYGILLRTEALFDRDVKSMELLETVAKNALYPYQVTLL